MEAQRVCGTHGGRAPQTKKAARQRIGEAADRMALRLLGFTEDEGVPPAVVLAAVKDALDRAGLKPPTTVELTPGELNKISRTDIQQWVQALTAAGKRPSAVRHAYEVVRMVLAQAVADNRLPNNPADYVKLPTDHTAGRTVGVVDDSAMFLTP